MTSNVTFVTSMYQIYPPNTCENVKNIDERIVMLLQSHINLIMYVDDYNFNQFSAFANDHVLIIRKPLSELTIYQKFINDKVNITLPEQRNTNKDTFEYMLLMNCKVELLALAEPLIKTPYVGWIDAGISKIFTNPRASFNKIANLEIKNLDCVLMPCPSWHEYFTFEDLKYGIRWNFCGGFLIMPTSYATQFYRLCFEALEKCYKERCMFWEVNVWIWVYQKYSHIFQRYYGNHDDTIIAIPQTFL